MGSKYDRMLDAALDATGRKYRAEIMAWETTKKVGPWVIAAAALAAAGYGAWWLWTVQVWPHLSTIGAGVNPGPVPPGSTGVPTWVWAATVGVLLLGGWLYRPGVRYRLGGRVAPAVFLLILCAGLGGVALSTLT